MMFSLVVSVVALLTLLFENTSADRLVAARIGTCTRKMAYGIISMTRADCQFMGGAWNGNPGYYSWTSCHLDWCRITESGSIASGDVFAICEHSEQTAQYGRTYGIVTMKRFECDALNGKYNGNPRNDEWIGCHLYWCKFSGSQKNNIDGVVPASVDQCRGGKVAYGIITMIQKECSVLGGRWNRNPGAYDWIGCHLDFCVTISCEPRDEWQDIQICSNGLSIPTKCSVKLIVGTTKTTGTSSTNTNSVSITVEHGIGIELEDIFSASSKVGVTTGFEWSKTHSSSEAFSKLTERYTEVEVPPHSTVRVQQVIGYCGEYKVNTFHFRVAPY